MESIKKLLDLINKEERNQAIKLLGMILFMAILDMLGVVSILPFMALLSNADMVEKNKILEEVYNFLKFTDVQSFLFFLGAVVFVLLVVSLGFKAISTYMQLKFSLMLEYSLSKRLVEGYLNQPYIWFLNRHSADLGKTILSEVNHVIYQAVIPLMQLITQGAILAVLLGALVIFDPVLSFAIAAVLSIAYIIVYKTNRSLLLRMGKEVVKDNQARFTSVSEAFGAIKEIKVRSLEHAYIQRFAKPGKAYALNQVKSKAISQLPRFLFEAIAFGGMLLLILFFMSQGESFSEVLPVISLYALAGYRIMPALQQVYGALTQLRFSGPSLDHLHKDLMGLSPPYFEQSQSNIILKKNITLEKIFFSYPQAADSALSGVTLNIPAKKTTAFVGLTGSGKTTIVDLILGLLEAKEGALVIDGQIITKENIKSWQQAIGYVPQNIYLIDDSVTANIAFGVNAHQVNQEAVVRAAKMANLHDFIMNDLPESYSTVVGERGIRLSGGQRQRIGIARALYNSPQILILDEATSALDNITEKIVMEAIQNLGHEITIILIAHRLSTVRSCDQIFLLEKGKVIAQGRFEELVNTSEQFRAMAAFD